MTRLHFPNILMDTDLWSNMLSELSRNNFPPTDIKKLDDDKFIIQMSLAGYSKNNINVSQEKQVLVVEGSYDENEDTSYLMRGISKRAFKRMFPLADNIEVGGVEMNDGMLSVGLIRNVPDNEKPKTFDIK
jgi:molecular chaperone IbpA